MRLQDLERFSRFDRVYAFGVYAYELSESLDRAIRP